MDSLMFQNDEQSEYIPLGEDGEAVSPDECSPHARLKVIEHTLVELQKYLETVIGLVREELHDVSEPPRPPLPDSIDEIIVDSGYDDIISEERQIHDQEIRGIFTGDTIRTDEGSEFAVPANYASKSRLVQGDILIVHTGPDGRHIFKQAGPIKRRWTKGILEQDQSSRIFYARCPEGRLRVLAASVSYFKGVAGDTVSCMIPAKGLCLWAAVERITKSS